MGLHASDGESQWAENKGKTQKWSSIYIPKQGPTHPQKSKAEEGLNEHQMARLREGWLIPVLMLERRMESSTSEVW